MFDDQAGLPPHNPEARDAVAELEAIVHLTGGDFTPFIEIAKSDVGFVYEFDAVAAIRNLNAADYARLIARLRPRLRFASRRSRRPCALREGKVRTTGPASL